MPTELARTPAEIYMQALVSGKWYCTIPVIPLFAVMVRFNFRWLLFLYFAGVILFFVQSAFGQRTRNLLIDLAPEQVQPESTPTPAPLGSATRPSRVLTPASPENPDSKTPPPPGLPGISGGKIPVVSAPSINRELGKILLGNSPVSDTPDSSSAPAPADDVRTPLTKLQTDVIVSVLEDETEDEREERELVALRQRVEQISDPERRQQELELLERDETSRRNRLERRQTEEAGADLFYFPRLKENLLKDGWCQLFDGHTDFGWKIQTEGPYAGPYGGGKFTFGQGEIASDPNFPGMVYTQIPFGDVSIRFDYWAEKDSRVFLLLKTPPNPADLNKSCFTFVLNSDAMSRPRGLLLGRHGHTLSELRNMRATWDDPMNSEEGTWHSVLVTTEEDTLRVSLDKRSAMSYFDSEIPLRSGHVAFLVTKGKARFQNILWQPNQSVAIFDPDNTTGGIPWRLSENGDFAGNNDTGFRLFTGSVESKEVFTNYVLQMQYQQGNISGRSSLFVRSLPGQDHTGYEISLQNFPRRKDREADVGADAGGFPKIQDARYVRAQDQRWMYLTVAAVDRQIQTWVNGVPVCEIFERRRIREANPKGPFLDPGTIRISVPKENDEFQFRLLTVSPIQ